MTALEICLIIIGVAAIAVSYFISDKTAYERMKKTARDLVLSEESRETLRTQTRETVEKVLEDMTEDIAGKAERELEKLSNEKIMSVHDYSDTVLEEINKNHNEVMFLYSMLDDKEKEIKDIVREVQNVARSVRHMDAEKEQTEQELLPEQEEERTEQTVSEDLASQEAEAGDISGNNNDRILKLHKEGKSNLEIAKELGLGLGEVKLVIDLFQEVAS